MDRRVIRWLGMMGLLCAMVQMNDPIRGMFLRGSSRAPEWLRSSLVDDRRAYAEQRACLASMGNPAVHLGGHCR
jgi:hypothetical protein